MATTKTVFLYLCSSDFAGYDFLVKQGWRFLTARNQFYSNFLINGRIRWVEKNKSLCACCGIVLQFYFVKTQVYVISNISGDLRLRTLEHHNPIWVNHALSQLVQCYVVDSVHSIIKIVKSACESTNELVVLVNRFDTKLEYVSCWLS